MFANLNVHIKTENIWFLLWNIAMVENCSTKYAPNLRPVLIKPWSFGPLVGQSLVSGPAHDLVD